MKWKWKPRSEEYVCEKCGSVMRIGGSETATEGRRTEIKLLMCPKCHHALQVHRRGPLVKSFLLGHLLRRRRS